MYIVVRSATATVVIVIEVLTLMEILQIISSFSPCSAFFADYIPNFTKMGEQLSKLAALLCFSDATKLLLRILLRKFPLEDLKDLEDLEDLSS